MSKLPDGSWEVMRTGDRVVMLVRCDGKYSIEGMDDCMWMYPGVLYLLAEAIQSRLAREDDRIVR